MKFPIKHTEETIRADKIGYREMIRFIDLAKADGIKINGITEYATKIRFSMEDYECELRKDDMLKGNIKGIYTCYKKGYDLHLKCKALLGDK